MTSPTLLKEQIIGQTIQRVTYFEINDLEHPFTFDGFDNFDLGINIEFSNGFQWHCGWKENERPEAGTGSYDPEEYYPDAEYLKTDATDKWLSLTTAPVTDFEIEYVSEKWKLPARLIFRFEDNQQITLVISEDLNADGSLPLPLQYAEYTEFYIFYSKETPPFKLIKINVPEFNPNEQADPGKKWELKTQPFIGVLIILLILAATFYFLIIGIKGEILFG